MRPAKIEISRPAKVPQKKKVKKKKEVKKNYREFEASLGIYKTLSQKHQNKNNYRN